MPNYMKIKPKPLGILKIGLVIGFIGAFAKILKRDFATDVILVGLLIQIIGIVIFYRWYKNARNKEKNYSIKE